MTAAAVDAAQKHWRSMAKTEFPEWPGLQHFFLKKFFTGECIVEDKCGRRHATLSPKMLKKDEFLLFRSFDELRVRALLYRQIELASLESALAALDKPPVPGERTMIAEENKEIRCKERSELMDKISIALKD